MIYTDIPRTRVAKKEDNVSESEVALELASEKFFDERGDAEVIEAEVVDFVYDYANN